MINKLKNNFKNNLIEKKLKIKKTGTKIYTSSLSNSTITNNSFFNKNTLGYDYNFKFTDFITFSVRTIILDKKTKEYAKNLNYFNLFSNSLYIKKNEI